MKASQQQIEIMAAEANPYKSSAPYGDETRGYKLGFADGYNQRDKELSKRISDDELRRQFEATYEPNMIHPDTDKFIEIAKKYANI